METAEQILRQMQDENVDRRVLTKIACDIIRYSPVDADLTTWDLITDERSRSAVEVAEAYADGGDIPYHLFLEHRSKAYSAWQDNVNSQYHLYRAVVELIRSVAFYNSAANSADPYENANGVAEIAAGIVDFAAHRARQVAWNTARQQPTEEGAIAILNASEKSEREKSMVLIREWQLNYIFKTLPDFNFIRESNENSNG